MMAPRKRSRRKKIPTKPWTPAQATKNIQAKARADLKIATQNTLVKGSAGET